MYKFPNTFKSEQLDYSGLRAVSTTSMMSEYPEHFEQIVKIIKLSQPLNQRLRVLDGTAHVGGFTLPWATRFPHHITSVEIDEETFRALKYNIKKLKLRNVDAVQSDLLAFLKNARGKFDFIYIDPPWGGRDYIKQKKMGLFLSGVPIVTVVRRLKKITNQIFLKIPRNFDIDLLKSLDYRIWPIYKAGKVSYLLVRITLVP